MKSPLLRHSAPGSLTVIPLGIILCFSQIPEGRAEASVEESRIEAVTVYPRGARVTRNLTLTLEPGSNTIELPGLPVEVDPSSLRLADGPDWLSITSVESRHRLLDEARDAPSRELLARIQAVMRARQSDPRTRSHRILGEAHGHSFMPSATDKRCQECSLNHHDNEMIPAGKRNHRTCDEPENPGQSDSKD